MATSANVLGRQVQRYKDAPQFKKKDLYDHASIAYSALNHKLQSLLCDLLREIFKC